MPTFEITKESVVPETFRTAAVRGMFDYKETSIIERFSGNIEIDGRDWCVGVIVGASGSGKSTIARQTFGITALAAFSAPSVIDDMPQTHDIKTIVKTFTAVGFASPPSWLKPYAVLSTGEQMRVDLAAALLSDADPIVFDEFTSVVNREVAKTGAFAVQKSVRRAKRKFVAVTCHRDVVEWLEPDWVYDTDEKQFFFALVNTNGRRSNSTFEKLTNRAGEQCGPVLQNIII